MLRFICIGIAKYPTICFVKNTAH